MLSQKEDIKTTVAKLNQLPAKKRLDEIINHKTPLLIVRAMPTGDLLLTIRELGAESSLLLIEMLHPKQVQEILDLEIWSDQGLKLKNAGFYFSLLFEANPDTAIAQIHALDIELIGLMLKTVSDIYDTSLGEEPIDFPDLYSTSPDGRFIICFHDRPGLRGLARGLHTFIEELYGRDLSFVLRLLESLRFELTSSLEEESLNFRRHRLLDLGILPREERLEYFSIVDKNSITKQRAPDSSETTASTSLVLPINDVEMDRRYPFIYAALQASPSSIAQTFSHEISFISLNMHASLSGDFGDRDAMIKTSNYVSFLADLGLMHTCQGNLSSAASHIATTRANHLIRVGRTTLIALRRRIMATVKDNDHLFGVDFCHLDSPLREVLQAISLPEPGYYEGLLDPKKLTVRYFDNFNEVNATLNAIDEAIFRAALIGQQGLGITSEMLRDKNLSHAAILARCLVNAYRGISSPLLPIHENTALDLFDSDQRLKKDFVNFSRQFASDLHHRRQNHLDNDKGKIDAFLTTIFIQLEQNWRSLL